MTAITPETLDRLRELNEAATPLPWKSTKGTLGLSENIPISAPATVRWIRNLDDGRRATSFVAACEGHGCKNNEDAELIALMRNALPALLATARQMQALDSLHQRVILATAWLEQNSDPIQPAGRSTLVELLRAIDLALDASSAEIPERQE